MIFPIFLVLLGAWFLLGNLGYIPTASWDLIWPSLLVLIGVYMLLKKVRCRKCGASGCAVCERKDCSCK